MEQGRILFIEDDRSGREMGVYNLSQAGYEVDGAGSGEEGLKLFSPQRYDLVITDVKMPGISGMEVLKKIKEQAPDMPVLVITAYANVELAVEAVKLGAFDFIGKPFSRGYLLIKVKSAIDTTQLTKEIRSLRIKASGIERPIIYKSTAMEQTIGVADRVAGSDATVLITGDSGTGKELIARRIHVRSSRPDGPFVAVNAAAIPKELLESELFGHEKGSFTGAIKDRVGRFRQANKGTIFLDEIAEFPLDLQSKLLRVLQERVVDVVGNDQPEPIDVRVIAATNRSLEEEVQAGRFREDLFYRLNVFSIEMVPLRERPEDIEPLAKYFIELYAQGRELEASEAVMRQLRSRPWLGNVRELENACQRLSILAPGTKVRVEDLPPLVAKVQENSKSPETERILSEWPPLPENGLSLIEIEKSIIKRVLNLKAGNITQTAAYLDIPRHILAYRMEKYGISR